MRDSGYHVVTFDYRGFADSKKAGQPSEKGAVDDIITVIKWMYKHQIVTEKCQLLVWGHSLGTSLSTQAICKVQLDHPGISPNGLVLEAPFNTLMEELKCYPLSKYFMKFYPGPLEPLMWGLMEGAFRMQDIQLNTDDYLYRVKCPVLILHAEDDHKIDISLAKKLYDSAHDHQDSERKAIKFVSFKRSHGFGHCRIYKHPALTSIVGDFFNKDNLPERATTCL